MPETARRGPETSLTLCEQILAFLNDIYAGKGVVVTDKNAEELLQKIAYGSGSFIKEQSVVEQAKAFLDELEANGWF